MRFLRRTLPALALGMGFGLNAASAQHEIITTSHGLPVSSASYMDSSPTRGWYGSVDAMFLKRDVSTNATQIANLAGAPVLTANAFSFDWEVGPRVLVGTTLDSCTGLEIGYMGLYDMNATAFFGGVGLANGLPITNVNINYQSEMSSVEVNMRRWTSDQVSILAGLRYINWEETLNGNLTAVVPGAGGLPATANGRTSNDLFGFQVGADWQSCPSDRLGFRAGAKAGLYFNDADSIQSAAVPAIGVNPIARDASGETSFQAEINVMATYRLTDCISLRAGYMVMWLEGIALAPDQPPVTNLAIPGTNIDTNGGVFLHGATAGIEFKW